MSKSIAKTVLLVALVVILLAGCATTQKWPRVSIQQSRTRYDYINLPLRDGYVFSEQPFTIQKTDVGYDIVIHAVRKSNE